MMQMQLMYWPKDQILGDGRINKQNLGPFQKEKKNCHTFGIRKRGKEFAFEKLALGRIV